VLALFLFPVLFFEVETVFRPLVWNLDGLDIFISHQDIKEDG